jgi:hypothetical protein
VNSEFAKCNLLSNEVYVDFHVFGLAMMNRIMREVDCRNVVTIHDGGLVDDDV